MAGPRGTGLCYHHRMTIRISTLAALAVVAALAGCNPQFDWRDYHSPEAPYSVLFPGKPATHTRSVNLDGQQASMTMTAADVDGSTFAVGSAELADATAAERAVQAMKVAMVRNIGAADATETVRDGGIDLVAHGAGGKRPLALHGRFVARGKRAYQVIVIGPEHGVDGENVDTFLRSFTLH
jgi:hypothetical protein